MSPERLPRHVRDDIKYAEYLQVRGEAVGLHVMHWTVTHDSGTHKHFAFVLPNAEFFGLLDEENARFRAIHEADDHPPELCEPYEDADVLSTETMLRQDTFASSFISRRDALERAASPFMRRAS